MTETLASMITAARGATRDVASAEAHEALDREEIHLVVDVREPLEFRAERLPAAVNVPRGVLELRTDPASPAADPALTAERSARILVYCAKGPGARSLLAAETLAKMGYERVEVLGGGMFAWDKAGFPLERGQ